MQESIINKRCLLTNVIPNHDFAFAERGAIVDGACIATALLPGYPIAAIRTGQYGADGRLWEVEIARPGGE